MTQRTSVLLVAAAMAVLGLVARPQARQAAPAGGGQRGQGSGRQPATISPATEGRARQGRGGQQPAQNFDNVDVHALHVQGNVWMLVGAGGNVTVQAGDEGVLLVDTSFAQMSDKILGEIRKISSKPIYYIVNTHAHPDHVGGNENLARPGTEFLAPPQVQIIAHENVLNRMSAPTGQQAAFPVGAWPTDTYFTTQKEIFFNNEPVILIHQPAAHTDGDSIVFFRRSDVVVTGDIFQTTVFPYIDTERGGTIAGIIAAMNNVLDITIPKDKQEGGTYVIPGHGRLCDEHDVLEYRDMLTIIRDRAQDAVKKGMTLDQFKAGKPTLEYDARWGSSGGLQTTDQFIEKIFNETKTASRKQEVGSGK